MNTSDGSDRKQCTRCGEIKYVECFPADRRKDGRRMARCKSCRSAVAGAWNKTNSGSKAIYMQHYQAANREVLRAYNRVYGKVYRRVSLVYKRKVATYVSETTRTLLKLKRVARCADCRKRFRPECLDFDHVRGVKGWAIGSRRASTRVSLRRELLKTELVCACCHRVRTRKRQGAVSTKRLTQLAWVLDELKDYPCEDCAKRFPPEAMDFDHRPEETKSCDVGSFRAYTYRYLPKLLAEVRKCDLVCACCHRTRTVNRLRA